MIEKKAFIEFVQNRLQGGDTPMDVRSFYHPLVIARAIDLALADLVANDPNMAASMSVPYAITITQTGSNYEAILPVSTIGPAGLIQANVGDQIYYPCDISEFLQMKKINPGISLAAVMGGSKLRFSKQPAETTGEAYVIPRISSAKNTDVIVLEENQTRLYDIVMKIMRSGVMQPEKINDSSPDVQHK